MRPGVFMRGTPSSTRCSVIDDPFLAGRRGSVGAAGCKYRSADASQRWRILFAVAARPHASLLDGQICPTALDQAAALLHGIAVWRPLELWNAGLAWTVADVRLERAGLVLAMPAKERMALTDELTTGALDRVDEIALRLSPYLEMMG